MTSLARSSRFLPAIALLALLWAGPAAAQVCCPWSGLDTGAQQCCPAGNVCGNPGCALPAPQPSATWTGVCPSTTPVVCVTGRCCDAAHPNCCGDAGCCDEAHPYCCGNTCCDEAHPFCCGDGKCAADPTQCSSGCPVGYAQTPGKGCCPAGLPYTCNDLSCDLSPNCHGVGLLGSPDPRLTRGAGRDGG